MNQLKASKFQPIRDQLNSLLYNSFQASLPAYQKIFKDTSPVLDHFAIIDISSPNSGISHLKSIFQRIGYTQRGADFLPKKANDFAWLAEENSSQKLPEQALPQVVFGDFRSSLFTNKT